MSEGTEYPVLALKKGEDRRLRAGHLWIYSNEVDVERTPLSDFQPGEAAAICDAAGQVLGLGYVNPHSLICARLMQRGTARPIDRAFLVHRLNVALALRERAFGKPYYRLIYGESDGLPGLVLDRFGDVLVGQIGTAGMERLKDDIAAAVEKVLRPQALVWKNDAGVRELEGLASEVTTAFGEVSQPLLVEEAGQRFAVDPLHGQKTGWFYDQRANRGRLDPWVRGARVLDLFSYVGAWGMRAAALGAEQVLCVDSASYAVESTIDNALRNGLAGKVSAQRGDVFEVLRSLRAERQRFDVVILDPPAFIKRRKDHREGLLAYRRLNEMAMQVLERDGILVTCSCSHHLGRDELLAQVQQGARHLDRQAQMLVPLHQDVDHPVHPAIPETDYLKGYVFRVLPA
jgi:23S rRNA (cytosine1962-C5)-methyltransferase